MFAPSRPRNGDFSQADHHAGRRKTETESNKIGASASKEIGCTELVGRGGRYTLSRLQADGYRVHLTNTCAVKHYSGLKYADDKHDARWLARLLALGILPEGYIHPRRGRPARFLVAAALTPFSLGEVSRNTLRGGVHGILCVDKHARTIHGVLTNVRPEQAVV